MTTHSNPLANAQSVAAPAVARDCQPGRPPRVAVIVPAFGVAHFLGEALTSLQRQTFEDWECIVIDDGAPDDVAAAVAPFLTDRRIRFVATSNHGVSAARNRAVAETTAPLVALLDGDDLFRPGYLAAVVPILEADLTVSLVTTNARIFGAVARVRHSVERPHRACGTLAEVLDRSFNVHIASTFRRADLDAVGGFDPDMAQSEDFDLWVRLMLLEGTAHYVSDALCEYRVRPGSASANAGLMLLGNIHTYEKAQAALAENAPEAALLIRLIAESQSALAFEEAIDHIVAGDTQQGLADLRLARDQVAGLPWYLAFSLWLVLPALARPMLRWRRHAHSRGTAGSVMVPSLFATGQ